MRYHLLKSLFCIGLLVLPWHSLSAQDIQDDAASIPIPRQKPDYTGPMLSGEITLDDVLQSSIVHFPKIQAALAKIDAKRGEALEARGPFDLELNNTTYTRYSGFYSGDFTDTELKKRFQDYNASVALGYRIADGDFPTYQDYFFTNEDGEASLKIAFSLLRNRDIDKDRFSIFKNDLGIDQTSLDALITKLSIQRKAYSSYMSWIAAGKRKRAYQALLKIALEREKAMERQVEAGDESEATLIENQQFIIQRKAILLSAERDFENASNALSLFLRNANGQPIVPKETQVPKRFPTLSTELYDDIDQEVSRVVEQNPEIQKLRNDMALAAQEVALGENSLQPKLDVELYNAEDFGFGEFGSRSREGFESTATVRLSFNLQQRLGQGQIQQGRARLKKLEFEQQQMADELRIALENIVNNIETALNIVDLGEREIAVTRQMEDIEYTRFQNGQSNFFLVNVREVNTADAQIKYIEAQRTYLEALGNYLVATLDFETLGVE